MFLFDRILNKEIDFKQIEQPVLLGRYLFTSNQNDIILNNNKVEENDYLVPGNENEAVIYLDKEKTKLQFNDNELYNEASIIKHTINDVSEELTIIDDIADVKSINILLRNFDKRLEITSFELDLEQKLFHLEEVCRDPSYHLKREISKVNIARAKRIPVKAINYLAAHTEDWSRRRIRSVEPRKILSEIIEYDLEIYENKITTSFIDKLLRYFSYRMVNEVEVIDVFINKIEEIVASRTQKDEDNIVYWHKKSNRDYQKLGEAVKSIDSSREKLERLKSFIASIQMRLFALLKSNLYRANFNKQTKGAQKLKRTNLFDNHQHYRFVKILWENLHKKEVLTCEQKAIINQKTVKAYTTYVWTIFLRALSQVGCTTTELDKNNIKFENPKFPTIKISLNRDEKEKITLTLDKKKLVFIPMPISKQISNSKSNKTYYISLAEGNSDNTIRVSPTDINSEERITSLIFHAILKELKTNYLFKLNSQDIAGFRIIREWLHSKDTLVLDQSKNKTIDLWLKRKLNTLESKAFTKHINKQRQEINKHPKTRDNELEKLSKIKQQIETDAKSHFEQYEICLSCGTKQESNLTVDNKIGYNYKCTNKECQVEYGYKNDEMFYKVPDLKKIKNNLLKTTDFSDKETVLNAFGYEYIDK